MNDGHSQHVGLKYQKRRVEAGLSQEQLSKRSGVGRTRLSHFETGKLVLKESELTALRGVLALTFERRRQDAESVLSDGVV